jgi:transcriptional regulator with XRE-family HTH domain
MNLKEFAMEAGISPKTIWNWKTGRRRPSLALQERIAIRINNQGTANVIEEFARK